MLTLEGVRIRGMRLEKIGELIVKRPIPLPQSICFRRRRSREIFKAMDFEGECK